MSQVCCCLRALALSHAVWTTTPTPTGLASSNPSGLTPFQRGPFSSDSLKMPILGPWAHSPPDPCSVESSPQTDILCYSVCFAEFALIFHLSRYVIISKHQRLGSLNIRKFSFMAVEGGSSSWCLTFWVDEGSQACWPPHSCHVLTKSPTM